MTSEDHAAEPINTETLENIRWAYQLAIELSNSWTSASFALANTFIVANSIIAAAITFTLSSQGLEFLGGRVLPTVGLTLCTVWLLLTHRSSAFSVYYLLSARELEESYLAPYVQTVSRGARLSEGKSISLRFDNKTATMQLSLGRLVKVRWGYYVVIGVFSILYVGTMIWL